VSTDGTVVLEREEYILKVLSACVGQDSRKALLDAVEACRAAKTLDDFEAREPSLNVSSSPLPFTCGCVGILLL
jgi:hypothetical protein